MGGSRAGPVASAAAGEAEELLPGRPGWPGSRRSRELPGLGAGRRLPREPPGTVPGAAPSVFKEPALTPPRPPGRYPPEPGVPVPGVPVPGVPFRPSLRSHPRLSVPARSGSARVSAVPDHRCASLGQCSRPGSVTAVSLSPPVALWARCGSRGSGVSLPPPTCVSRAPAAVRAPDVPVPDVPVPDVPVPDALSAEKYACRGQGRAGAARIPRRPRWLRPSGHRPGSGCCSLMGPCSHRGSRVGVGVGVTRGPVGLPVAPRARGWTVSHRQDAGTASSPWTPH